MKTVLVNYASPSFAPYQAINSLTGRQFGFDRSLSYGPGDIDAEFSRRNAATLNMPGGAGCWLWKPYVVARVLNELNQGDVLFYADAAMHFVNPIDPVLRLLDRHGSDLLILGEGFVEAQYTKRDAFVLMDADHHRCVRTSQRFASAFVLRKSVWADEFVSRYLQCAEDARIITDGPNTCGLPNYPEFIAHRHDQSIFSLLTKLERVPVLAPDLIAEGLPSRGRQIINPTRAHHSPAAILRDLLIQGVLSISDLEEMVNSRRVPPGIPA